MGSSDHVPWHVPRQVIYVHTKAYIHFHKCHNLEVTKMSFSRGIDQLWPIETMEYSSVLKKK